ncbi:MAG: pseudouridine-5'-phosphate glycosidase [Anaerolineae bacterium]|nr:pseudouridine-5'-phosphate glycosidase [Anaerolineae bacterium]
MDHSEFCVSSQVKAAVEQGQPVVALESALITHGFAPPYNLEIARRMEEMIRTNGVCPATIAVLDGRVHVGLSDEELARLAVGIGLRKLSLRDLPLAAAQGASGGTTVAATMHLAYRAGIQVFATGGIGGVHRGRPEDVSADLFALASIPIVTVCAGAKAILDLPRTLEMLETLGVPVIGYLTDEFPAFYSRRSGLKVGGRAESPEDIARIARERTALGLSTAVLVCVPVPEAAEIPAEEVEACISRAVEEAERAKITGSALTPFLLGRLVELTGGRARLANEALLVNNACLASHIARALAR